MTIGNQQYKAKDDFTGEGLGYWYICLNFQVRSRRGLGSIYFQPLPQASNSSLLDGVRV